MAGLACETLGGKFSTGIVHPVVGASLSFQRLGRVWMRKAWRLWRLEGRNTWTWRAASVRCSLWGDARVWSMTLAPLIPSPFSHKIVESRRRRVGLHLAFCSF
mmetsp:Transcript_95531/g.274061  ORF Transcript_95531/g.274061 Transcript_95531/m.274061 type:complete len:103 (+) Transcript_95531:771-1079(+)